MTLTIIIILLIAAYGVWKLIVGWMMLGAKDSGSRLEEYKLEYADGSTESAGDLVRRESRKDVFKGCAALAIAAIMLSGLIAG